MTTRIGNTVILAPEAPQKCELCGKVEETRPYGPKGEEICFDCGMKDEPTTKKMMDAVLFGKPQ